MRKLRKAYLPAVGVLLVLFLGCWAIRGGLSLTGVQAAPPVSPEMERLTKMYLGNWEYSETYPKTPAAPQGGVNSGIYKSELGPGGNSLVNRFHPFLMPTGLEISRQRLQCGVFAGWEE